MSDPLTRRLCLAAAAALAIVLLSAFVWQPDTVPIHIDIAGMFTKAIYGVLGLIGAAIVWLAQQALATLKGLDAKMTGASQKLTKIDHELFGPEGNNGMRSDVKDAKKELKRHSRVLAVLADREGIPFHEDDE